MSLAVSEGSDSKIAFALDLLLRMTDALVKPKRGGHQGAKQVRSAIRRELSASTGTYKEAVVSGEIRYVPSDVEGKRIARASDLVRRGWRSRAAKVLRSDEEMRVLGGDEKKAFLNLFPSPRTPISELTPPKDSDDLFVMGPHDFVVALKSTFNGASGGPSGFMGEHIRDILHNLDVQMSLLRFFTLLINGRFPKWTHPYLCSHKLFALGGKARPVCVGEWIIRTASKLAESRVPEGQSIDYFLHRSEGLHVVQLATDVPGGAEVAVMMVDCLAHQTGKKRIIIKKDATKAFNNCDRVVGVELMSQVFPTMARWSKWFYGTPALLRMQDGSWTWGREGFYQGDAVASRAHDCLLQKAAIQAGKSCVEKMRQQTEALRKTGGVEFESLADPDELWVIMFRDDVYLLGEVGTVLEANDQFDKDRQEITGMTENRTKTQAYIPLSSFSSTGGAIDEECASRVESTERIILGSTYITQENISTQGMMVLGAPVGSDGFVEESIVEISNKYPNFLPRVSIMPTQIALTLLRECHLPIYTHMIRMVAPLHTIPACKQLDKDIRETYCKIVNEPNDVSEDAFYSYHAPLKHSAGLGFRKIEDLAPIAYFDSRMGATNFISNCVDEELRLILENVQLEFDASDQHEPHQQSPPQAPSPPTSPPHPPTSPSSPSRAHENQAQSAKTTFVAGELEGNNAGVSPSHSQAANSINAAAENGEGNSKGAISFFEVKEALDNVFLSMLCKGSLTHAWSEVFYRMPDHEVLKILSEDEKWPNSQKELLAGVSSKMPKYQNYLTKSIEKGKEMKPSSAARPSRKSPSATSIRRKARSG
jgi:hypothetical protein